MKFLFAILSLVLLSASLQAETADEFAARVTAAYQSKDPEKVLALYGEKLDPEFAKMKRAAIESEFSGPMKIKSAHVTPLFKRDKKPDIKEGKIYQLPADSDASIELERYTEGQPGQFWTVMPVIKDKNEHYWLASPEATPFEWKGPKISRFDFRMSTEGNVNPNVNFIVVTETCGYRSWEKISGQSSMFRAHKLLQLIVPPTVGVKSITFEIRKDNGEPFFKKDIDTSKGAVIPVAP